MHAFIDGDVLVYEAGYTTQEVDKWIARARMRDMLKTIFNAMHSLYGSDVTFEIYLSDSNSNFRKGLFPEYKANRTQEKPIHHEFLQNLLSDEWEAEVAFGEEADDALSIRQHGSRKAGNPSVICSIDKDLHQVPGLHYNWRTETEQEISEHEALYKFYKQLLTGDSGDNITTKTGLGCKGIGEKKAAAILEGCETEAEFFQQVYNQYHISWKDFPKTEIDRKLLLTGRLIKLRTYPGEIWNFPIEPNYEEVRSLLSSPDSMTPKSLSLEHTRQDRSGGSPVAGQKTEPTGSKTGSDTEPPWM